MSPSANVEKFNAAYAERKQMLNGSSATRSSDPIMLATRQNPVVMTSAIVGSPASLSGAARWRKGTVPSAAMALRILGAEMRHCSACESNPR